MRNQVMLDDIRSQGEALAEGLERAREQLADAAIDASPARIVLAGSGDSFIASLAVQPLFQRYGGVPVLALPSLDASRYVDVGPGDLVVVSSVSGEVARSIEVALRAKPAGAGSVAVTSAGDSTLGRAADAVVTIPEPIDRAIPHSRDYSVTLLALACILERVVGTELPELSKLPAIVADVVDRSFETLEAVPSGAGRTWFLGAGPDRATAMFGALKYWEAAGMEAWWDDLEEFGHGSQLMAKPGDRAVLIARGPGSSRALEMVPGLGEMGLDVVLVGAADMRLDGRPHLFTTDDLEAEWHPFASCVPLQAMTYAEAEARGLDVSVPLFGHEHGPAFDRVHAEWMRDSEIVPGDGASS